MVRLSKTFWVNLYTKYKLVAYPYLNFAEAGIVTESRHFKTGYNVTGNPNDYKGQLYFQWAKDKEIKTTFQAARGNLDVLNYNFTSVTRIPGYDDFNLSGMLVLAESNPGADVSWKYGDTWYGASLLYQPGEESRLKGTLKINDVDYQGEVVYAKNDIENRLEVDMKADKHIYFRAASKADFSSVDIELFWDKDVDATKSVSFQSVIGSRSFEVKVKALEESGKFSGSFTPSSLQGEVVWGRHNGNIQLETELSSTKVNLLLSIKSSIPVLEEVRAHLFLASETEIKHRHFMTKVSFILYYPWLCK